MNQDTLRELRSELVAATGTYVLNIKQVSKLLNKSPATLARWRKQNLHLKYSKKDDAANGSIEYPVHSVAEYILSNLIKIN